MGGAALNTFGLPSSLRQNVNILAPKLLLELSYDADGLAEYLRVNEPKLLPDQRLAYKTVISAVEKQAGGIFFLDPPGGTGKSFLTQLILAKIRCKIQIVLAVASSGIAATLLQRSLMQLYPIQIFESPIFTVDLQCKPSMHPYPMQTFDAAFSNADFQGNLLQCISSMQP
ncbi:uncharacterized protein LOC115232242 [Octopus sinensis]|uniref:ATP-dependent DNA helicase n=1 Tax=Octopus sinensis TaxID=2607531 RepID=A0A6P7U6E2_9MOLL|nr:uncharacterized protein LOC115232242 [Octopus sinensis]